MLEHLKTMLHAILTEAGVYSINRVVPFWLINIFTVIMVVVTLSTLVAENKFAHYNDLCMVYLGVLVACGSWLQGNKITNSIWNTPAGMTGKPTMPTLSGPRLAEKTESVVNKVNTTINNNEEAK